MVEYEDRQYVMALVHALPVRVVVTVRVSYAVPAGQGHRVGGSSQQIISILGDNVPEFKLMDNAAWQWFEAQGYTLASRSKNPPDGGRQVITFVK